MSFETTCEIIGMLVVYGGAILAGCGICAGLVWILGKLPTSEEKRERHARH